MFRSLLVLTAACAAAPLVAQAAPGLLAAPQKDSLFTVQNLDQLGLFRSGATNKAITQINFTKTPTRDRDGQWTVALTLRDLAPAYGGSSSGGQYVVSGQWDAEKGTFTPSKECNAVNDPNNGDSFGLMIEPRDGICCTVDQKDGIYFSLRDNVNQVFPTPLKVVPAPNTPPLPTDTQGNNPYVDPVPCFLDATTIVLMFTDDQNSIVYRPLTLNFNRQNVLTSVVAAAPVTVFKSNDRPHSPTPILDRDGNLRGLFFAINKGTDSDMYFLPTTDGSGQAQLVYDTPGWLNNGGVAGGRFFFADAADGSAAYTGPVSWLLGSTVAIGEKATITTATRNAARPLNPLRTLLAMSLHPNNGTIPPVPLPGWNGAFALNLPMDVFSSSLSYFRDELSYGVINIPKSSVLIGVTVTIQGAAQPQGQAPTLTNTTPISITQ